MFRALSIVAISALIGYITNWVAIRMLFRPRRAWHIFGKRVPLTPGLFPRRRTELAVSLGEAIRRHLLTEAAFDERLSDPELRGRLRATLEHYLQEWLSRDRPSLHEMIPPRFEGEFRQLLDQLKDQLKGVIRSLLAGPELEKFVRAQMAAKLDEWLAQPLDALVPAELLDQIPERAGALLAPLARDRSFQSRVARFVEDRIVSSLKAERPLREFLPEALRKTLYQKLDEFTPEILDRLVHLLEDEPIKKRIKIQVYEMVDAALAQSFRDNSLWDRIKFGFFEGYIMSAEELKARVDRGIDEAGMRLRELVQQAGVRERVHQALVSAVEGLLARRLCELQLPPEALAQLSEQAAQGIVNLATSPAFQNQLSAWLSEHWRTARSRPLRELAPDFFETKTLSAIFSTRLTALLRDEPTACAMTDIVWAEIERLVHRPIGRLKRFVSPGLSSKVCAAATDQFIELLRRELPQILAALDLQQLIAREVEKLSVEEVEALVLRVTGDQLSAITWFGALLGALIGLIHFIIGGVR